MDKNFITRITENEEDAAIIRAILAMAESLNLSVVAEGVETPNQLEFLRSLHCMGGQGYLFSRPLPIDRLTNFLKSYLQNH